MSPREKRTVLIGSVAIVVYLAVFFGSKSFGGLGAIRADYENQVRAAHTLRAEVDIYKNRAEKLGRLMERSRLDPGKLSTNTVVGQTSAALQQAAMSNGLQLGAIRESVARSNPREIGTIQLDAMGPPIAILNFLARMDKLGFPVLVDSIQYSSDPRGPGMLRLHLNLIVLDFEQWKPRPPSHA